MHVVIVGAGAAGCFCAINLKRRIPDARVTIIEKGSKPLAKVAVTGGGRCNITNSFQEVKSIKKVYPRGDKLMKRALKAFSNTDTLQWFENENIEFVTQPDQCVFPKSQDAMEVVNKLVKLMSQLGVKLYSGTSVEKIIHNNDSTFSVVTSDNQDIIADKVVVTAGGKPTDDGFSFLKSLILDIISPIPSLFTFNVNDKKLHELMGTVVDPVSARIVGTSYGSEGAFLITHWGLSGPAVLKLSSYAARHLADNNYKSEVCINWFGNMKEHEVLALLADTQAQNQQKQIGNAWPNTPVNPNADTNKMFTITQNLWTYLLDKVGLPPQKRWQEVGSKQMNRLASLLTNDIYSITGKGKFKDEFVTCGGVALSNIDINTMESKNHPGLFFAGEILDVDAITGGFNLQAAWSMGYIVSQSI